MREYYTVVYCVDGDKAAHDEWWRSIKHLFMADEAAISIVCVTRDDIVSKYEAAVHD